MIIFIRYPLNDERFRQIRDETEVRKLADIKAHHKDPKDFITPNHTVYLPGHGAEKGKDGGPGRNRRGSPIVGAGVSPPDAPELPHDRTHQVGAQGCTGGDAESDAHREEQGGYASGKVASSRAGAD